MKLSTIKRRFNKEFKWVTYPNPLIKAAPRIWTFILEYFEPKSNQVEAQVSDDFGGQPLKLTGKELNTLIDLLEIFYDDHYDKLHTKLMNKKYEIVNNISQNSL